MHEHQVRDLLAANLELLEPGLRLRDTEHRLRSNDGSVAFADILARDKHGNIVVIEVKHKDHAAREAAHQVFKYAEILHREYGQPAGTVRVVIASTTWRELGRSFSGYADKAGFDVRGYHLRLNPEGTDLIGADQVELKEPALAIEPSDTHVTFVFDTRRDRDEAWERLVARGQYYGADHLLGFDFVARPDRDVFGDYLLYLVVGTLNPADDRVGRIRLDDEEDDQDSRDAEHRLQRHLLRELMPNIAKGGGCDLGSPSILADRLSSRSSWRFEEHVRSCGAFELQADHYNSREWMARATAGSGYLQNMFLGSESPSNRVGWERFKRRIRRSLGTNPDWRELTAAVLEPIGRDTPDADVDVVILNPTDLVGTLTESWPDQFGEGPSLTIRVRRQDGEDRRIRGLLMGRTGVDGFLLRVGLVYRSPEVWRMAHAADEVTEHDLALLEVLGLQYALIEGVAEPEPHFQLHRFEQDEIVTHTIPAGPMQHFHEYGLIPLSMFLAEQRGEVDQLVREYRRWLEAFSSCPPRSTT